MKKLVSTICILGAVAALAQNKAITITEASVKPVKAEIDMSLEDGGCKLVVYATSDQPNVVVAPQKYDYNGQRCVDLRATATAAAKKDLGVGSGKAP